MRREAVLQPVGHVAVAESEVALAELDVDEASEMEQERTSQEGGGRLTGVATERGRPDPPLDRVPPLKTARRLDESPHCRGVAHPSRVGPRLRLPLRRLLNLPLLAPDLGQSLRENCGHMISYLVTLVRW